MPLQLLGTSLNLRQELEKDAIPREGSGQGRGPAQLILLVTSLSLPSTCLIQRGLILDSSNPFPFRFKDIVAAPSVSYAASWEIPLSHHSCVHHITVTLSETNHSHVLSPVCPFRI